MYNIGQRRPFASIWIATVLAGALVSGCLDDKKQPISTDLTPPTFAGSTPLDSASDVPVDGVITVSFSESIDPASVNALTFSLSKRGSKVAGTVTSTGATAIFAPSANLEEATVYTVTLTTGIRDLAGNPLGEEHTFSFTTGSAPDRVAPTVASTRPGADETRVAADSTVSVTFSEPMLASTLTTDTFTLSAGGEAVEGVVTYTGRTATFAPSASLANDTTYTATVTIGATDLAGNPLPVAHSWTFTTSSPVDTTPPSVLSTNPENGTTGFPLNGSIIINFSEPIYPSSVNLSTFTVSFPTAGGSTFLAGTPSALGAAAIFAPAAPLDYGTTYTVTLTTGVRDLGGNPLGGNHVFTFSTNARPDTTAPAVTSSSPANNAIGVGVNTAITVTFTEAMNPGTLSLATFTVSADGRGVPGSVSYSGRTATFTPTAALAFDTNYTAVVTAGATDVAGNLLSGNFTWSFRTAPSPDIVRPTVISTSPADQEAGVPTSSSIIINFSEPMDPATLNTGSFVVTGGGFSASGTVVTAGTAAIFIPAASLLPGTAYSATVTTAARDIAGNPIQANHSWQFTTAPARDTTPPSISSRTPTFGGTDVPLDQVIAVEFSEAIDPGSVQPNSFTVTAGSVSVPGTVSFTGAGATFAPTKRLGLRTSYTATIRAGLRDFSGNALPSNSSWSFTTRDGSWSGAHVVEAENAGVSSPAVAVDGKNDVIVAWAQGGRIWARRHRAGGDWDSVAPVDQDTGRPSSNPAVVADSGGNAVVIWEEEDAGSVRHIWANRFVAGGGWGVAERIDAVADAGASSQPALVVDAAGNTTAIWVQEKVATGNVVAVDTWVNRHTPAAGWANPTKLDLSNNAKFSADPRIGVQPASGTLIAIWQNDTNVLASDFIQGSWGSVEIINRQPGPASKPALAFGPAGTALALWIQDDDGAASVWASRYVLGGQGWETAAAIESEPGAVGAPRISMGAAGSAFAIWPQQVGGLTRVRARRYSQGGWQGTPSTVDSTNPFGAADPRVAVDPTGNAVAVWDQSEAGRNDVWAARYVVGLGWRLATRIETNNGGGSSRPLVAVDSDGFGVAIWPQFDGLRFNLWANFFE